MVFDKRASTSSGSLQASATVLDVPVTFTGQVPDATLVTTITSGLTIGKLCRYALGQSFQTPAFLDDIGLLQMTLTLNFKNEVYTLSALLASDVTIPAVGEFKNASVTATISPQGQTVCLDADWIPVGLSTSVPVHYCNPFNKLCPPGAPACIDPFPPKPGPPPSPPVPLPPSQVTDWVEALIAGGTSIAAAAWQAFSIGGSSSSVSSGLFGGTGTGGSNWSDLNDIVSALEKLYSSEFQGDPKAMIENVIAGSGSTPPLETMTGSLEAAGYSSTSVAPALESVYAPSPAGMLQALVGAYAGLDAPAATDAMASAPYPAAAAAGPIHATYLAQTATGPALAGLLMGAQPPFVPKVDLDGLARALAAAPLDVAATLAGLVASFPTTDVHAAADALAGAGGAQLFPPGPVAAALAAEWPHEPEVSTATGLASLLAKAYPMAGPAVILPVLAAREFPPYAAAPAVAAAIQPRPSVSALGEALLAAYPQLTPLQLGNAVAATGAAAADVAAVLRASIPSVADAAAQQIAGVACAPTYAAVLSAAVAERAAGQDVAAAANAIAGGRVTDGSALTMALASVYSPALDPLAHAVIRWVSRPENAAQDLLLTALETTPSTLAVTVLTALWTEPPGQWTPPPALPLAAIVSTALVEAYASVGRTLTPTEVAVAMVEGLSSVTVPVTPTDLYDALAEAFGASGPAQFVPALAAALDITTAASAVPALVEPLKSAGVPFQQAVAVLSHVFRDWTAVQTDAVAAIYGGGATGPGAGVMAMFAGDLSQPGALAALKESGWLVCDGASYPITAYPDLFAAIGVAHGGSGDSFNVPDLRDRFPRGVNGSASSGGKTVDPDAASRTAAQPGGATGNAVGSFQPEAVALPVNPFTVSPAGAHSHAGEHLNEQDHQAWNGSARYMARNPGALAPLAPAGSHSHTIVGGDAATEPASVALYPIIQAADAAHSQEDEATVELPVGSLAAFAGPIPNAALARDGWVPCDGTLYTFPVEPSEPLFELYTTIGWNFGAKGIGEFNVPDFRGKFLRGTSHGTKVDPDRDTRVPSIYGGVRGDEVGSMQGWATGVPTNAFTAALAGAHSHDVVGLPQNDHHVAEGASGPCAKNTMAWPGNTVTSTMAPDHTHTIVGGDGETRPANIYANWMLASRPGSSLPPIGTVMPFAASVLDLDVLSALRAAGWIPCDGSALDKDDVQYEPLHAVLGGIYGADGDMFNVPDLRGYFVTGAGGKRAVGSRQMYSTGLPKTTPFTTDEYPDHTHTLDGLPTDQHEIDIVAGWDMAAWNGDPSPTSADQGHMHAISGGDAESRPINVYVDYIIRFR